MHVKVIFLFTNTWATDPSLFQSSCIHLYWGPVLKKDYSSILKYHNHCMNPVFTNTVWILFSTYLDNTQAYNAFVFVIIKDNILKYMLHLDLFYLCLLSSKPFIAWAQQIPPFYDDKPNDHIDIQGGNKLVPKQVKPK